MCRPGVYLLPLADPAEISLHCCTHRTEIHVKNSVDNSFLKSCLEAMVVRSGCESVIFSGYHFICYEKCLLDSS